VASKNTIVLPEAVTSRIQQLRKQLENETVKVQHVIHGMCEGQVLVSGSTGGRWTLSADATAIELEGE
jgi:hypothetical protein